MAHYENYYGVDEDYYRDQERNQAEYEDLLYELASLIQHDIAKVMLYTTMIGDCTNKESRKLLVKRLINEMKGE